MPSLMDYCKPVGDTMVFTGNKLEIHIPMRYAQNNLLTVADIVETLAIFSMIVDDKHKFKLMLPCVIKMNPSQTYRETIDDIDYLICVFTTGDKLLTTRTVLKQPHIAVYMYQEFISLGHLPKFLDYNSNAFLFDTAVSVTDIKLNIPHSIYELIIAFCSRDPDNLFTKYRFTDMKKQPTFIGTSSIAFGPESTTAKLIGAYFNDGVDSALINAADKQSDLEDLLRK